jgi:hypothetical protein
MLCQHNNLLNKIQKILLKYRKAITLLISDRLLSQPSNQFSTLFVS